MGTSSRSYSMRLKALNFDLQTLNSLNPKPQTKSLNPKLYALRLKLQAIKPYTTNSKPRDKHKNNKAGVISKFVNPGSRKHLPSLEMPSWQP